MKLYDITQNGISKFTPSLIALNQNHAEYLAVKNHGYGQGQFKNAKVEEVENSEVLFIDSFSELCSIPGVETSGSEIHTILCF